MSFYNKEFVYNVLNLNWYEWLFIYVVKFIKGLFIIKKKKKQHLILYFGFLCT